MEKGDIVKILKKLKIYNYYHMLSLQYFILFFNLIVSYNNFNYYRYLTKKKKKSLKIYKIYRAI